MIHLARMPVKAALILLLAGLTACAVPRVQEVAATAMDPARLLQDSVVMPDGYVLPLRTWPADGSPVAAVLGLHGFNDYGNAFDGPARYFSAHSIMTYAIDQRGFGNTAQRGMWAGHSIMQSDLVTSVGLLCARHPELRLYLLGESMGGAVILDAADALADTCVQGIILAAPAVWGWQTMPWWQRTVLWLAAHTLPGRTVTGEGLDIRPSDNVEMLRALGRDPLVIKATRIDAIYGLTDLMEAALVNSPVLPVPTLMLYGEHDEIIPPRPTCRMLELLPAGQPPGWRMVLYSNGFHMLTRDLQAEVVLQDIVNWIKDSGSDMPSGLEVDRDAPRLRQVCGS